MKIELKPFRLGAVGDVRLRENNAGEVQVVWQSDSSLGIYANYQLSAYASGPVGVPMR